MINLSSGGRTRVSGAVSGIMILLFILFLSPLIERIPLAALVGVMFVVAQQTFAWSSLQVLGKVPRHDALLIVAVTAITVATDLAVAVLCGIVIAALSFAWRHAREIRADVTEADGVKTYTPHGTLFFASIAHFNELFDPQADPRQVALDCRHLRLADHSAVVAVASLSERYAKAGKTLQVLHLSRRCEKLLQHSGVMVTA
jgi:SulP family sulfate permease